VFIASQGKQLALLKEEFTNVHFVELPGYNISYQKSGWFTYLGLLLQTPSIVYAIKKEKLWLKNFLLDHKIDLIISDNRYGLYDNKVLSIIITHQLSIKTFQGKWFDNIVQKIHYKYLNRFHQCWVPDFEGAHNYAGDLSHPEQLPSVAVKYIGPLSRFEGIPGRKEIYTLLIILSGPEPQRTLLEHLLLTQLQDYLEPAVLMRGLPGHTDLPLNNNANLVIYNHLSSALLAEIISSSRFIVSRPGYTTVMELLPLKKKCLFIPTPGQTEQSYLARYLQDKRYALSFSQEKFDLKEALCKANEFPYEIAESGSSGTYKEVLQSVIGVLNSE
jgi:UDP-N-acetylglucosamine transferase subunit ALG13